MGVQACEVGVPRYIARLALAARRGHGACSDLRGALVCFGGGSEGEVVEEAHCAGDLLLELVKRAFNDERAGGGEENLAVST